jgi:opacity protein-like surface antigen
VCAVAAVAAVALAFPVHRGEAQEIGPYVGGGVGGIRDVRRPFGGGVSATLLFHDWIGIRGDAGYYWTLEHRIGCFAVRNVGEAGSHCVTTRLASSSHFPLLDGMAVLRAHIPGKGVRFEVGAGPAWVDVHTHIHSTADTTLETTVSSSRAGAVLMAGMLAHPDWKIPLTLEGMYVYHNNAAFGACDPTRLNDPLCNQHLNFHELRFSLLYRFAAVRP